MNKKFYDTSSLLLKTNSLFNKQENFAISSITLEELERIKTSSNKDIETKNLAKKLTYLLDQHFGEYDVIIYDATMAEQINDLYINNDAKILACALSYKITYPNLIFITNDLCLKHLARIYFDNVESVENKKDNYTGYKEIILNNEELQEFYSHPEQNNLSILENEYLVIKNNENQIIDLRVWRNEKWNYLDADSIKSRQLGQFKPYDIYQKMAIDSMRNNQLTVIRGLAGSGKSLSALSYLFHLLETYQIDKIFIFCNPVATKDSAKLGFYPGDRNTKLLDSQIGNFLIGKLGDITAAEQLVASGKLVLMPAADIRGVSIPDNCGVYITEAQNTTKDLMKLMVQRISENTKIIIEGDDLTQVDLQTYAGNNNGLTRLSQVYRGQPYYGEVRLNKCYRSKLAEKAEEF